MSGLDTGKNTFVYSNGSLIAMQKRAAGFYQVAYINGVEKKSQRFDMVIGSGTKGQSYATCYKAGYCNYPLLILPVPANGATAPAIPIRLLLTGPLHRVV